MKTLLGLLIFTILFGAIGLVVLIAVAVKFFALIAVIIGLMIFEKPLAALCMKIVDAFSLETHPGDES